MKKKRRRKITLCMIILYSTGYFLVKSISPIDPLFSTKYHLNVVAFFSVEREKEGKLKQKINLKNKPKNKIKIKLN